MAIASIAAIAGLSACGSDDGNEPIVTGPTPYKLPALPFYWPEMPIPADNPLTVEGVALGRMLFYDSILSADSTMSCASCHQQQFAFSDGGQRVSKGVHGEVGTRNTPAIVNAGWQNRGFFWDGRAERLENQAEEPVPNPIEMDLSWDDAVARLQAHPDYPDLFAEVFGDGPITQDLVVKAIAQFERTLISANSRFDQWQRGEIPFTDSELRGREIFITERGDCFHCHTLPALFTDNDFHNVGLDLQSDDGGLGGFTGRVFHWDMFKTPTLRNIEYSSPYMHDGRFETLEEVIQHYIDGWVDSPTLDPLYSARDTMNIVLTPVEIVDLTNFLKALSDPDFISNPEFANPFEE